MVENLHNFQKLFDDFLSCNGFDRYGQKKDSSEIYFENEVFFLRPCYDGDETEDLPNFVYKPTSYNFSWEGYPLHNIRASEDISEHEFARILKECANSLKTQEEKDKIETDNTAYNETNIERQNCQDTMFSMARSLDAIAGNLKSIANCLEIIANNIQKIN